MKNNSFIVNLLIVERLQKEIVHSTINRKLIAHIIDSANYATEISSSYYQKICARF